MGMASTPAGDRQVIAHAALAADQMQPSTLPGQRDGKFDQRGNSGTIDLRNVVEVHDQFSSSILHQVLREFVQVLAGFANGEPAMDLKVVDAAGFARRNFQRWMKRHEIPSQFSLDGCSPQRRQSRPLHYTMKGMEKKSMEARRHLWKVSCQEAWAIQATLRELWVGCDRFETVRTVAGLDAAFVLTSSQAMRQKPTAGTRCARQIVPLLVSWSTSFRKCQKLNGTLRLCRWNFPMFRAY